MADKCMHRLHDGSFCKRWAAHDSRFCSHHQGSTAHLEYAEAPELHPLARLTTPEDIFDLLRETLNATRLGRMAPAQAYAIGYLVSQWRKSYQELGQRQRETAMYRQILPDLMLTEEQLEAERAEAPHPLPVSVDGPAAAQHLSCEPINPPLKPLSDYPGWAERYGPKAPPAGAADLPSAESVAHIGRIVPPQPAPEEPGAAFAAGVPASSGNGRRPG